MRVEQPAQAYQALSELRRLADETTPGLRGSAIIERRADGRWEVPERTRTPRTRPP